MYLEKKKARMAENHWKLSAQSALAGEQLVADFRWLLTITRHDVGWLWKQRKIMWIKLFARQRPPYISRVMNIGMLLKKSRCARARAFHYDGMRKRQWHEASKFRRVFALLMQIFVTQNLRYSILIECYWTSLCANSDFYKSSNNYINISRKMYYAV